MDYFSILNLKKEPFSNSPDPDFFFPSKQHVFCLQQLEIAIHLRRGLNVVIGNVGTGKTTLCRQFIRKLSLHDNIETHLILDPLFNSSAEFVDKIIEFTKCLENLEENSESNKKEQVKKYLFEQGINKEKNIVLIIDEGQKVPLFVLETLREFLNFETNENKLLQIVIFAQDEFELTLQALPNFTDRINLIFHLSPLSFWETEQMIRYRLKQASESSNPSSCFNFFAFIAIYLSTGGYPRKIVNLCHQSLLTLIIQNRHKAGWFLIRSCAKRQQLTGKPTKAGPVFIVSLLLLFIACYITFSPLVLKPEHVFLFNFKKMKIVGEEGSEVVRANPKTTLAFPGKAINFPHGPASNNLQEVRTTVSEPHVVSQETDVKRNDLQMEADLPTKSADGLALRPSVPSFIGQVVIGEGDTLNFLILKLYGRYSVNIFQRIIDSNPHIVNPDELKVGNRIFFPPVLDYIQPTSTTIWKIIFGEERDLQQAFALLRSPEIQSLSCRLLPYYKENEGINIYVVLNEIFLDESSAEKIQKNLKMMNNLNTEIVTISPQQEKIFLANPF